MRFGSGFAWNALGAAAALGVAACTPDKQEPIGPEGVDQRIFDAETRRAAAALSIANSSTTPVSDDPYEEALLCTTSLELLGSRLEQTSLLSTEQKRALDQAKTFYRNRLLALAESKDMNTQEVDLAVREVVDTQEPASRLQAAFGCLRRLT